MTSTAFNEDELKDFAFHITGSKEQAEQFLEALEAVLLADAEEEIIDESKLLAFQQEQFQYARDVVFGKIKVGRLAYLACWRSLEYLKAARDPFSEEYFDPFATEKIRRFALKFKHLEGDDTFGGKPFVLEPWQLWLLAQIFGWKNKATGHRIVRTAHIDVPRGNGKSFMVSILVLYMLSCDGRYGPKVYCAATTREQAQAVYKAVEEHVLGNKRLMDALGIKRKAYSIQCRNKFGLGEFKSLSRDTKAFDGKNVYLGIVDELHAVDEKVWNVLNSGAAKSANTLMIAITTAGLNLDSFGYSRRKFCECVLNGEVTMRSFFCVVWSADIDDAPFEEATLEKANPAWHSAINREKVLDEAKEARVLKTSYIEYMPKRLNLWLNAATQWMDPSKVQSTYKPDLRPDDVPGIATIGVDMARVGDMTAVVLVKCDREISGNIYAFPYYFLPKNTIENDSRNLYQQWRDDGHLIECGEEAISYDMIKDHIRSLDEQHNCESINFDEALGRETGEVLSNEGRSVFFIKQVSIYLTEPIIKLEEKLVTAKFFHNNPIMSWNIRNCVMFEGKKGLLSLEKEKKAPDNKIDGVDAVLNCLFSVKNNEDDEPMFFSPKPKADS
ncbi:hypothetical protein HK22_02070 [Gluconobacter sp. DsW_056]|uniref:terminase large subunit n=1 Tax=Gluconobacter sp. DsW_056 TaxID=1511209 RepID=UPI000A38F212|nr:terminase large subunit [Gluconobacter sp. DsW_056]OUI81666.1 hypothetical protein HK22_02070 [Gluconobacter sp. DsW_056]